jgi:hypothetical protein
LLCKRGSFGACLEFLIRRVEKKKERVPFPLGYGVTVTEPAGVLCLCRGLPACRCSS